MHVHENVIVPDDWQIDLLDRVDERLLVPEQRNI